MKPAMKKEISEPGKSVFEKFGLTFAYITETDLPDIVRMLAKESVCEYVFFGPNTEQETRAYFEPLVESIQTALAERKRPTEHVFTIRKDGEFLGQCALLPVAFSPGNFLIGFTIDDTHWRQGIGENACRFLIDFAFQVLNARRVSGDCMQGNTGSRKVMEKCGFKFEVAQRKYWNKNGRIYDNWLFGQLKDQSTPKEIVTRWIELFNKADSIGLAELYHDDAVNHQVANEPVEGKAAIRSMFEREFAAAEMVCVPENLFEDGEWAILEWRDPLDLRGCGFFYIVDGKIRFQRGYWDKLSFLRQHGLPIPTE